MQEGDPHEVINLAREPTALLETEGIGVTCAYC